MAASVPTLPMSTREQVAGGLASALLAGPWERAPMQARVQDALGRRQSPRWLTELVDAVIAGYPRPPVDRPRELTAYLQHCPAWRKAWEHRRPPRIVHWYPVATRIERLRWPVAELSDAGALAEWLGLDQGELTWFADVRGLNRRLPPRLWHYRWAVLPRPGGRIRLVAAPKPRLKAIQRQILRGVLEPIALHAAAHGGVAGRSVQTAVAPHAGQVVVVRADIESFFASIRAGRVWNLLRFAGLPEPVAYDLTGLMTTVAPVSVLCAHRDRLTPADRARLRTPHLPVGAPTSTATANLLAYSLDRRLTGLADRFGASYTRYVDDLVFSGGRGLRNSRARFVALVEQIATSEGLALNDRKTVVLGRSGRQQVLGAVVNDHPTLPRIERDTLRAILHNCVVHGWRSQARGRDSFPEYLRGRIAWAGSLDPALGRRLLNAYEQIDWR